MSARPLALVTGGSRGVGRATVLELAHTHRVAFSFRRDQGSADEVVAAVEAAGGEAFHFAADLGDPGAATELVRSVEGMGGRLGVVVGNAGSASRGLPTVETTQEEYLRLLQVHALSNIELAAAAMPSLRVNRGSLIFVTSAVTELLPPFTAPYAGAKAALEAMAVVMAREERVHGVRVNVVAPGLVATDMGDRLTRATGGGQSAADLDAASPLGHVCRPAEVATAIAYLAGSGASYVSGERLRIDGGGPNHTMVPGTH